MDADPSPVDGASWPGHYKVRDIWYSGKKLEAFLVKDHGYSEKDAGRMCFEYGLDPRNKGDRRQESCPCPDRRGHEAKDVKFHKFPRGFSFIVMKAPQDFR